MVLLIHSICCLASSSRYASCLLFATAAAPVVARRPRAKASGRTGAGALTSLHNDLGSIRTLTGKREKVKVLLVLYDGKQHSKDVPELLGTTENELGIRKWLEDQGHKLVTMSDKEGIGSDHADLNAANKCNGGITVAEVTGSNVVLVAEHVVMTILVLVRNFVPAHEQIQAGDWDVTAAAKNEFDLEGKIIGTVAPFDCKELLYFDYQPLKPEVKKEIDCHRVDTLEELLAQSDVVTINCPLHEKTHGLFNKELIIGMKPNMCSWLVNTARGAIVVKEDIAEELKSGHLRCYGGDVWFPQPAPKDHPLRYGKNPFGGGNAMVPHMSGTSLDAQKRCLSDKHDYRPEDLIAHGGDYATKAYGQRK
ncbi:hypothetical protein OIDMADRAFT_42903 [Oidiodendron maius Zn]|uniref:Formate dehydrogenase n=1 Tax=Oidiodendron maius (strain Zn) TaxID=913774 RepID=A0A0C3H9W2_OIDMZ|nr:hypothetical protein OIDMADRAFT_42903 [Oidiodendron maius Zn]